MPVFKNSPFAPDVGPWPLRILRWTARAATVPSLALLALFATSGGAAPSAYEWLLIAFFPVGVAVGMAIAWRDELLGGGIAAGSLAVFHALLLVDASRPPAGPWFVVFASPGLALLLCGALGRRSGRRTG